MKKSFVIFSDVLICIVALVASCNKADTQIVMLTPGNDLQAAIDNAEEDTEIRIQGGTLFYGPIYMKNHVKLSGGWVDNFTRQDFNNRSIIDGQNKDVCIFSKFGDVVISGFEIRNAIGSGIVFSGKLTVEYCWIHNCFNTGMGGGITGMDEPGDDLMLANSILEYNKADAHGGALCVAGKDTRMVVVNCLFRGNASIAQYGYTGAIHGQGGVQAFLVNNTIVENVNWRDGSSDTSTPWSAVMFRNGGTHIEMVNNIVAGNWYFKPGVANIKEDPNRYNMPIKNKYLLELQIQNVDLNVIAGDDPNWVCQSNVIAGANSTDFIGRAGGGESQDKAQKACTFVSNSKWKTIFVSVKDGDFHPAGPALTTGEASDLVKSLLGTYTTDLDGNPRIVGGKICAGCYQAQ